MDVRNMLFRMLTEVSKEIIRESLGVKKPRKNFSELYQEITLFVQNYRCNRCGKVLRI